MAILPSRQSAEGDGHVRITTAAANKEDDIAGRQRLYVVSMLIRSACFVAAVAVGPGWLRWVLVVGAVFLPYFAVVMANTTDTREDGFALRHHLHHRELR